MRLHDTYINAGKIEEIKKQGCLRTSLLDRYVMVCYFDGEYIALDMGSKREMTECHAVPVDLLDMISTSENSSAEAFDKEWGKLILYPVRTDGESIFVGSNPL